MKFSVENECDEVEEDESEGEGEDKRKNQKICILRFNETDILSGLQSFLFVSHIK